MSTVAFARARQTPLPPDITKKLPVNLDAERNILGAILLDNSSLMTAAETGISADHFFLDQNQKIWRQMCQLALDKKPIDLVMLTEELASAGILEAAGGAAYLASLADGMPRVSNVGHYANIVIEKAKLRNLIHLTHNLQMRAFEGQDGAAAILENANQAIAAIQKTKAEENPAVVVGFRTLLTMEMPPLEFAIEPLLTTGGTGELYAWRGTGKSLLATKMSIDLAMGVPVLFPTMKGGGHWPVSRAYRNLYVYGEMHGSMIQERLQQTARGIGVNLPKDEWLGTMCKDFQKSWRPNISTPRNRKIIEERIFSGGYEGLFLDNISTLWPESQEGEGERSAVLSDWFMDLNQRGVWVIFLHHAGKGGTQRGSSEKEDMLDFVIRLRTPENKKHEPRLCAEVLLEKTRGEIKEGRWKMPFEVTLETTNGISNWLLRPAQDAQLESAFRMFADGMKPADVFGELGISRSTAFRYKRKYDQNSDAKQWAEEEA